MSFFCPDCNKNISGNSKVRHLRSQTHLVNANKPKEDIIIDETPKEIITNRETKEEDEVSEVVNYDIIKKNDDEDHSLEHLNNVNFVFEMPEVKEPKTKKEKPFKPVKMPEEVDEIFSDHPTEILGRDKHFLINKVRQYKALFPSELKGFKMKKKPTVEDLEKAIEEIEVIIAIKNIDLFIVQSILESIKLVEGFSSMTRYNIQGLADILKSNPQFLSLSKQLFLRYGSFVNIPPEYQMLILVSTTGYLCIQKNAKKQEMNNFLNQPVNI